MPCIDGLVLAVATANKQTFIAPAGRGDPVFTGYGATRVPECWGHDNGFLSSFGMTMFEVCQKTCATAR